jgi:hypothetical protein
VNREEIKMRFLRAAGVYGMANFLLFSSLALGQGTLNNVPASIVFYPDVIVHNAKVVTMDDHSVGINTPVGTIGQAMAVRDGKVMAVGSNAQILAMAGPRTERIDVKGRMVMPGIIDTHDHAHGGVANRWQDDHPDANQNVVKTYQLPAGRNDAERVSAITAAIQAHVQSTPPGTYALITIQSPPRDPNAKGLEAQLNYVSTWLYEGGFPKAKIDALAPNHPIQLYNLPAMIVNDAFVAALAKQYGKATQWGMNMDEQGRVRETATQYGRMMSSDVYFKTRVRDLAQALEEGLIAKTAVGVTTYTSHLMGERFQDAFRLLQKEGRSPVRMAFYHWNGLAAGFPDSALFYRKMGDWSGMGGDYFWNVGVSLGAIDSVLPRTCSKRRSAKAAQRPGVLPERSGVAHVRDHQDGHRKLLADQHYPRRGRQGNRFLHGRGGGGHEGQPRDHSGIHSLAASGQRSLSVQPFSYATAPDGAAGDVQELRRR